MATYKKRNPKKVEADLRGISTSWAQVDRLYSADGTLPNDSEHFGRDVLDYVASIINDVNNSTASGLRLFDSDLFRTGDGYGGRNWDLTDTYNADVVNAYAPLVAAMTNGNTQEFFSTNGGLRPARIKDHYNLVVTDSEGRMTSKNIYTIFKLYFDEYLANDFFARKALANRVIEGSSSDSEIAARMYTIINAQAGGSIVTAQDADSDKTQLLILVQNTDSDLRVGRVTGPIVITTDTLAETGGAYVVKTPGINITLPATPSVNDFVIIHDGTGTAETLPFTVKGNGSKIVSSDSDLTFDVNYQEITMSYLDNTIGWSV